ncbi:MFS transporter [Sessilibacter sp. MAH1]
MVPLIIPIGALLAGVALLLLGTGLLNTILALRSSIEGYSSTTLGLIMSSYFAGFFVGTYLALPIISRMGHIRAFAFCAAIAAATVLAHEIFVNPIAWMLLRVFTGISLVILYTVIESWLNGQTPSEQRGKVFAIYMTVNLGALAVAQQLLRIDPSITFLLFAISSILICLSLTPITWTRMKQPEVTDISRIKLSQVFKAAPVAVLSSAFSGLAMGAFWGLAAAYASKIGFQSSSVATFVTCAIVGGAVFQFPLGKFSDGQDRRKVIFIISAAAAVVALLLSVISSLPYAMFVVIAVYGGLAFAIYPVAVAHLVDHLDAKDMLGGSSQLLLINGIGSMMGPALAGQLMEIFGVNSLPIFWSVALAILALSSYWFIARSKQENPEDHNADFVPMLRTSPMAFEMLPPEQNEDGEIIEDSTSVWGGNDISHNPTETDENLDIDQTELREPNNSELNTDFESDELDTRNNQKHISDH